MIKLADIKLRPAKLRVELYLHHRWEGESERWIWAQEACSIEVGARRYFGLLVRNTNVRPITWIGFINLNPVFKLVLNVTWRYQQELRLKV